MICGYIYKIEFPNGKHYIGLTTTSLKQRQEEHKKCAKNGDTKCLYNALRKYEMVDTFELIEIDIADTLEELCEKEIEYILTYNSYYINKNGYNMTYGGEGTNGYVFTEEDRQKMSESQKKFNKENPAALIEHGKKMKIYYQEHPEIAKEHSERMKKRFEAYPELGKEHGERMKNYYEETLGAREKCSESQKKRFENPEARQQNREAQLKRFENPEARQKLSLIHKKRLENTEARQKLSERMKKYYEEHPEARQKNSEAQKKRFENPDAIQKNREAQLKYQEEHPEARQKMSERMKKYYEEHPEAKIEYGKKMKEYHNNPEAKKNILDIRGKNKQFDAFTVDGTFVKTFTYQFEAKEYLQKEYKITSTIKIGSVLTGTRNSSAGFVFKYK